MNDQPESLDDQLIDWLNGIRWGQAGGFLTTLADAANRADEHNWRILRPSLVKLMRKYPNYRHKKVA